MFERCEASGVSALAFCAREGIPRSSFARWQQRVHLAPLSPREAAFGELPFWAAEGSSAPLASGELELSLPGGVGLRWNAYAMWGTGAARRIFAYTKPTDMRKSFLGLLALVQQVFAGDQAPTRRRASSKPGAVH